MSIFSEKSHKRLPKNLDECTHPGSTVHELYDWVARVERIGGTLLGILIIAGIISTIASTSEASDISDELAVMTFFSSAITWVIPCIVEYIAYRLIALLLNTLATITEHTVISAKVALYQASKSEHPPETATPTTATPPKTATPTPATPPQTTDSTTGENTWICQACGYQNKNIYLVCRGCGERK